jgi:hypothetical protein
MPGCGVAGFFLVSLGSGLMVISKSPGRVGVPQLRQRRLVPPLDRSGSPPDQTR